MTVNSVSIQTILKNRSVDQSILDHYFIAPENISDIDSFDSFFLALFKSVLGKYKIKKPIDLVGLQPRLFKSSDFKRKTTLVLFIKYIVRHYGFELSSDDNKELVAPSFDFNKIIFYMDDFSFLSEKELLIFNYRIIENEILSVIGKMEDISLSRERVRQIEQKIRQLLFIYFSSTTLFPIKESFASNLFIDNKSMASFFNEELGLVVFKYLTSLKTVPYKFHKNLELFSTSDCNIFDLSEHMSSSHSTSGQLLFSEENLLSSCDFDFKGVKSELLNPLVEAKVLGKHEEEYFLYPKTKSQMIELYIYISGKVGYSLKDDFPNLISWMKIFSSESDLIKKENFNSLIEHNHNIILWNWGVYVHKFNVRSSFEFPGNKLILPILETKIKEMDIVNIKAVFDIVKEDCLSFGIKNPHSLYSVIRDTFHNKFNFKHSPWIKKLDNSLSVVEIIASFIEKENDVVSIKDIAIRYGLDSARISQLISYSDNIQSVGRGKVEYIKKDNL